jgi:hypothetical protein
VEPTRVIAAALLAISGLVLVLYVMAKARERKGSTNGSVALAGVITLVVFALLTVLVLTVLAVWLTWTLVVVAVVTVIVMAVSN